MTELTANGYGIRRLLTNARATIITDPTALAWRDGPQMKMFEQKYGRYMYLPLDIPRIEPNDKAAFKKWWVEASKPISRKYKTEEAGDLDYEGNGIFNAINSNGSMSRAWEINKRADFLELFPEIATNLDKFPFDKPPEFTIWSSNRTVKAHRDIGPGGGPWRDLPCAFRVMLYDENPEPTLGLIEAPTGEQIAKFPSFEDPRVFRIKRPADTNSFAWNNIRAIHFSNYEPPLFKCLMILSNTMFNLDKYEDLIERSISKYKDLVFESRRPLNDFCN